MRTVLLYVAYCEEVQSLKNKQTKKNKNGHKYFYCYGSFFPSLFYKDAVLWQLFTEFGTIKYVLEFWCTIKLLW